MDHGYRMVTEVSKHGWTMKLGGWWNHGTRSSGPFELNTPQQLGTRDKASECLEDKALEGKALEELIFKFQFI